MERTRAFARTNPRARSRAGSATETYDRQRRRRPSRLSLCVALLALIALAGPAGSYAADFVVTSGPGASSWGNGRVDVFAKGTDNALWHRSYDITGWGPWESLGGVITSDPAAVSWASGRIDVFARGSDNALYHRAFTSTGWHPWERLGGVLTSGPAVASWGEGRLDVFVRDLSYGLSHIAWTGSGWSGWSSLGGYLTRDPAAVSWGPNRIDVFAPGPTACPTDDSCTPTDRLMHIAWTGSSWSSWQSLGGELTSAAAAVSFGSGHLDVFARGVGDALFHKWWNGSSWSPWESLGGIISTSPDAAAWPGRIDVLAATSDGALWSKSLINSQWQPWQSLEGLPNPNQHIFATTTSRYVDVRNAVATWRIYTKCSDGVGPGYVARIIMNNPSNPLVDQPGNTLLDDPWGYQGPVPMGLGKLVFRHARAAYNEPLSYTPPDNNTWDDTGRTCATVGVNDELSGPINATPSYDAANDVAHVDEVVHFRDAYSTSLLSVTYKWRFYRHYLKMWAVVSPRCNGNSCPGGSPRMWIKGPKFVAGINGHPDADGYTQITTYNETPFPVGTAVCANRNGWPGVNAGACPSVSNPGIGINRTRLQFNYADPPPEGEAPEIMTPRCADSPLRRCFNAIFRSYTPSGTDQDPDITPGAFAPLWSTDTWGVQLLVDRRDRSLAEAGHDGERLPD